MHLLLLCVASGSSSRTITCYVCAICTHGIVVVLCLWLWLAVLRLARGSCENASVFDKSNGIFAVKQNSYLYTVSTAEGREMNLIFYFPACVSWAEWHVLYPRMSSTSGFYGAVSHKWITVATFDRTCIAHLRIRIQSIKMCWTFAFIIISYRTVYVTLILYNYVWKFLVPISAGPQTILKFKVDSLSSFRKTQDCVLTGSRMLHS